MQIKIFDTTLRDGEQSPGCSMRLEEKLLMAKQLEKLNVDIIEAGFAISSIGDYESVKAIAEVVKKVSVASLSRALPQDIERSAQALKNAVKPVIHTFIATSDIHLKYKLKKSKEQVLKQVQDMVSYAKTFCPTIEFSAEDASRSEPKFLVEIFETAIESGATVLNVPDTVGYTTPMEFYNLIKYLKTNITSISKAEISVHCHNDLGLAVANSLAAVGAGATQVEVAVNGIGERAGNAALEEFVMALKTRGDYFKVDCNVDTTKIYNASRMLTSITGVKVQPNKAIVGENAFAHEAGIHQHGVLANKSTYEIMTPESIGLTQNLLVLGKHSGKHAVIQRLEMFGYKFNENELQQIFKRFKLLADKKKTISDIDLEAIAQDKISHINKKSYELEDFSIFTGNKKQPRVEIYLKNNRGKIIAAKSEGDGPVDASFKAIESIVKLDLILKDFKINAIGTGRDAQGESLVKLFHPQSKRTIVGHGLSTDVLKAAILGYINAVNKLLVLERQNQ